MLTGLFLGLVAAALLAVIELAHILIALFRGWKAGGEIISARGLGVN
jgi:hypothetical protein